VSGLGRPAAARAAKSSGRLKPPKASRPSRRNSRRRCGPGQNKAATTPVPFMLFKNCLIIACGLLARQLDRSMAWAERNEVGVNHREPADHCKDRTETNTPFVLTSPLGLGITWCYVKNMSDKGGHSALFRGNRVSHNTLFRRKSAMSPFSVLYVPLFCSGGSHERRLTVRTEVGLSN
jgi:hypothetical protein